MADVVAGKIAPHIPVWENSQRADGIFSREDFAFDRQRDVYTCSAGETPITARHAGSDHIIGYRGSVPDCRACPLKPQCCPNMPACKLTRDVNEDARDVARALMKTPAFEASRDQRKMVEMRLAHQKTHHGFERLRLRGLASARDGFHLAAVVQDLKTRTLRQLGPPARRKRASVASA